MTYTIANKTHGSRHTTAVTTTAAWRPAAPDHVA